jgi:hypothetical protein
MTGTPKDAREAARKRIEDRRGFVPHLIRNASSGVPGANRLT